jgi:hypothetical protein
LDLCPTKSGREEKFLINDRLPGRESKNKNPAAFVKTNPPIPKKHYPRRKSTRRKKTER